MPRPTRAAKPPVQAVGNSLISSAARLTAGNMRRPKGNGATEWQQQAWYFFDTIGEFRFGASWLSHACSRAKLVVLRETPDGDERLEAGPEVEALAALFGGEAGQSQMLATIALHMTVPGETYVVGEVIEDPAAGEVDRWAIYSNEELTLSGETWQVDRGDGKKRPLAADAVVIRLWRPHPRKWVEADSPARASLPILREIENLTKHVSATVDSRLAGAGLLVLPQEMTFTPVHTDPNADPTADPFLDEFTTAMVTPIRDRANASAVVPLVIRVPGVLVDKIKHISFATPLDEHALELRTEAIRRLALSADMPPEVLLGLSDSNHWSAWQIDESALKVHVEPLLEVIAAGLTDRWLRPAVEALSAPWDPTVRIGFDTVDLRLRPDRTNEAMQLYDKLELSGKALRREVGFEESDAPDDNELAQTLLRRAAQGVTTADLTTAAMAELGAVLTPKQSEVDTTTPTVTGEQPATPAPATAPENNRDAPVAAAGAMLASAELLVGRAVERANNRLNRRSKVRKPIAPDQLDTALVDAWEAVPRTCELLGIEPDWFTHALDTYTRAVLTEGCDHEPTVLRRVLAAQAIDAAVLALPKGGSGG